ncbi:SPOC domain-containing protein 1 isoform X2 [Ascaphus truei]|uniref:SPOC domain-containing protein 1 isoform X2 n=1 Tax=Ascaphus truei TaxID=8439 RepID=UPI003F59C680
MELVHKAPALIVTPTHKGTQAEPPAGSLQEPGGQSSQGFFERFQIDLPDNWNDQAPDIRLMPPGESLDFISKRETEDPAEGSSLWGAVPPEGRTPEDRAPQCTRKMLWVVSADTLCPVINKRDESLYRLLGTWGAGSGEVHRLEELEDFLEPAELCPQILPAEDQQRSSDTSNHQERLDSDDIPSMTSEDARGLFRPYGAHLFKERTVRSHRPVVTEPGCLKRKWHANKRKREPVHKGEGKALYCSALTAAVMFPEEVRVTAVQTLRDVLLKRVQEAQDLDVREETVSCVAENVERELFMLFLRADHRYKNKYRSLLFNLKDPKNKVLFRRVVLGEITPQYLVMMSPTEMARQELAEWRNQESRHALEIIEREQRKDATRKTQLTKLTHKGLIEIDTEPDQNFTLEDLTDSVWKGSLYAHPTSAGTRDTTSQHKSHLLDPNCLICTGQIAPPDERGVSQHRTRKKANSDICRLQTPGILTDGNDLPSLSGEGAGNSEADSDVPGVGISEMPSENPAIWKGFIHMFSIKKFRVTAFPVAGYSNCLCQDLPSVITSRGLTRPVSVWEHVDLIWPACTKDMSLIRFGPRSSSDATSYTRLYSYLIRKEKYGIVSSDCMEMFVVPLPAFQPIPHRLHPLGGPGLEANHPSLLLALLLPKHSSWKALPKRSTKKQKRVEDISDDFLTDILADIEREEREQGLPPPCVLSNEQGPQSGELDGDEVGMSQLMNILQVLGSNLQLLGQYPGGAGEAQGFSAMQPTHQFNPLPAMPPFSAFPCCAMSAVPNMYGIPQMPIVYPPASVCNDTMNHPVM